MNNGLFEQSVKSVKSVSQFGLHQQQSVGHGHLSLRDDRTDRLTEQRACGQRALWSSQKEGITPARSWMRHLQPSAEVAQ